MALNNDDSILFKMEKLTTENYHNWKYSMKLYLLGKGLWDIITGDEVLPDEAEEPAKKAFKKRENLALAAIGLNVSKGLHIYVRNEITPKGAWDKLANHFEKKTLSKIIYYRRKLYAAKAESDTNMHSHVNYIKTIAEHLEAIGDAVVEKDLSIILLSSLPKEYAQLVTAIETLVPGDLVWDAVRDRVLNEYEKKRTDAEKPKEDIDALFTGRNNRWSRNGRDGGRGAHRGGGRGGHKNGSGVGDFTRDLSNFKCHNCHKPGHFKRNCPEKFKSVENESYRRDYAKISNSETDSFVPDFALKAGDEEEMVNWWIDSGASQHMTQNKEEILEYQKFSDPVKISLADNSVLLAHGKGDVNLSVYDGAKEIKIKLEGVLFVPKIKNKLLSLPVMLNKGIAVKFSNDNCILVVNENEYNVGHKHGKLFKLNTTPLENCCLASSTKNSPSLWHERYGHLGYDNLKIARNMVDGMDFDSKDIVDRQCEGCIYGKHCRTPFPKASSTKSSQPLDLIHSDVCGPMSVDSWGGSRYYITFIDDYSRYYFVYMIKHKSDAFEKFKDFVALTENKFGRKM